MYLFFSTLQIFLIKASRCGWIFLYFTDNNEKLPPVKRLLPSKKNKRPVRTDRVMTYFIILLFLTAVNCGEIDHHRVKRIIGGSPANYPPYDEPVVYVRFNERAARVTGVRDFPHYVFKGIKYAEPPVKQDRFLVS